MGPQDYSKIRLLDLEIHWCMTPYQTAESIERELRRLNEFFAVTGRMGEKSALADEDREPFRWDLAGCTGRSKYTMMSISYVNRAWLEGAP